MKWHKIEVDEEVFGYLKKIAEPFVDTPNSVLRRELLRRESPTTTVVSQYPQKNDNDHQKRFPIGIPAQLRQILEVVRLVKEEGYKRKEATHLVAKRHGIFTQTVNDKYGRQLGITADEFDRFLAQPSLSKLEALLIEKFPSHGDVIRDICESKTSGL